MYMGVRRGGGQIVGAVARICKVSDPQGYAYLSPFYTTKDSLSDLYTMHKMEPEYSTLAAFFESFHF